MYLNRIVTLVGARLLGVRVTTTHDAVPARWFDQRRRESVWREVSVRPEGRGSFADAAPLRARPAREEMEGGSRATVAREEDAMQKAGKIGKFLQLGSVVSGSERGSRWFALPGSWRAPRVQIMRQREQAASAEYDDRRSLRMLAPTGERGGF